MRDIYNDNKFDINNLKDLEKSSSFDVLSKDDTKIQFEYGSDFFILNLKDNSLIQYPDFVSLRDSKNSKIISYQGNHDEYAIPLINAIKQHKELDEIPEFSLKDRKEYIKGGIKDFHYSFVTELDIQAKANKKKELDQNLNSSIAALETKETKALTDVFKATIGIMTTFLLFWKPLKIEREKIRLIRDIKKKLLNKEIGLQDIYANKDLLRKVPELKDLLEKYSRNTLDLTIDTSIKKILEDPDVINVANKIANEHSQDLSDMIYDHLTIKFNQQVDDIEEIIRNDYEESGLNADDYIQDKTVNSVRNLLENKPEVAQRDFQVYTAYLYAVIDPANKHKINLAALENEDQGMFDTEKIADIMEINYELNLKQKNQKTL